MASCHFSKPTIYKIISVILKKSETDTFPKNFFMLKFDETNEKVSNKVSSKHRVYKFLVFNEFRAARCAHFFCSIAK